MNKVEFNLEIKDVVAICFVQLPHCKFGWYFLVCLGEFHHLHSDSMILHNTTKSQPVSLQMLPAFSELQGLGRPAETG